MAKMKILGGDIPQGITFYYNPGSINDLPVAAVFPVDPEELKKVGVGRSFGLGRKAHFVAEFGDGKRALVETDSRTYERLASDIAGGPVSAGAIEGRKKAIMCAVVVFFVTLILGQTVFGRYLTGSLPFLSALGLAVVARLVGGKIFSGGR